MRLKAMRSGNGTPSRFVTWISPPLEVAAGRTLRTIDDEVLVVEAARVLLERDDVAVGDDAAVARLQRVRADVVRDRARERVARVLGEDLAVGEERPDRRHPELLVPGSKLRLPVTVGSSDW